MASASLELTEQQRLRIAQNRDAALKKQRINRKLQASDLTEQQLALIARNREAALEKQRVRRIRNLLQQRRQKKIKTTSTENETECVKDTSTLTANRENLPPTLSNAVKQSDQKQSSLYESMSSITLDVHREGILVSGNTFIVKDILKAQGARWDPISKAWICQDGRKDALKSALRHVACVNDRSGGAPNRQRQRSRSPKRVAKALISHESRERDVPDFWKGPPENYFKNGQTSISTTIARCTKSLMQEEAFGDDERSQRCALAKLTEVCSCGANWHEALQGR